MVQGYVTILVESPKLGNPSMRVRRILDMSTSALFGL